MPKQRTTGPRSWHTFRLITHPETGNQWQLVASSGSHLRPKSKSLAQCNQAVASTNPVDVFIGVVVERL